MSNRIKSRICLVGVVIGLVVAIPAAEGANPARSRGKLSPGKRFVVSLTWYVDESACPGPGSGTPGDPFCKVQDAINSAVDGDTVVILLGRYYENIHLNGKNIALRSVDPTDPAVVAATILDGSQPVDPLNGSVITFVGTEGPACVIDGLTVTSDRRSSRRGVAMYHRLEPFRRAAVSVRALCLDLAGR